MNIIITLSLYFLIIIYGYHSTHKKMQRKEKVLFLILSSLALLSAIPASEGMDFDTVGSSLSGMISLFMH